MCTGKVDFSSPEVGHSRASKEQTPLSVATSTSWISLVLSVHLLVGGHIRDYPLKDSRCKLGREKYLQMS